MSLSLKFKHMGKNIVKILIPIISNQNFLRYVYYLTDEPLLHQTYDTQGNLINQPDIQDNPIGTSLLLTPFDPTVLTNSVVKVFIYPLRGNLSDPISNDVYEIIILCDISHYILNGSGELRLFMIAYEICQSIDNQYIAGAGSSVKITDWRMFKVNDTYAGLSVWANVSNGTLRG